MRYLLLFLATATLSAQTVELSEPPLTPPSIVKSPRPHALEAASTFFDTSSREAVRTYYNSVFVPTASVAMGWVGDVAAGNAGTTSQAYKDAVKARINWVRALAGVPPIAGIDPTYSAKAQQAAMMMSVNRQLNHMPTSNWINYTSDGAEAAGKSNLCLGFPPSDSGCILIYMQDFGDNNSAVGHRRWILHPPTQLMGTGDVAQSSSGGQNYSSANALWVFDANIFAPIPELRDGFVSWPPKGYVPTPLTSPRWSFSVPNADFTNAAVSMTKQGNSVPVAIAPVQNGYGLNTIVFVPENLDTNCKPGYCTMPPVSADTSYTVTVSNVIVSGTVKSYTYTVTQFDPAVAGVGAPPVTLTHTGNFIQGQPLALYTVMARNGGVAPSVGIVSVIDILPAGLTPTAISGPGWSCSLGTVSCSRADSLAAGANYPPITVMVSVSSNANSATVNQASITGGLGSSAATDPTAIRPAFVDVSENDSFLPAIDLLWESSITTGCQSNPPRYCPNDNITLGQMAVFVVRSVMGNDNFSYSTTPYFSDVPANHQFFKWIQKMQDLGIAVACAPNQYCPETAVTRGVMAVLIIRSRYGNFIPASYPQVPYFTDVGPSDAYFPWIQKMKQLGITSGCSPTTYCPSDPVTRGQMAVFIERGEFNLLLPDATPTITWVSAPGGSRGQTLTLNVVGSGSNFINGTTQVSAGQGITLANVNVTSATSLTVQLSIAGNTFAGPRSITVTTGAEDATLPNSFLIYQ